MRLVKTLSSLLTALSIVSVPVWGTGCEQPAGNTTPKPAATTEKSEQPAAKTEEAGSTIAPGGTEIPGDDAKADDKKTDETKADDKKADDKTDAAKKTEDE